ncbi:pleckstrin homology domain-containing family A member 7 isoform X2 [Xenopus laevis]|uniref:Pleckstrin homology domain-containing family A member 7 isoform X2 n=1 Tax=Xenopus laevis TaxID=8355 RepID=A0A8J1KI02_XENLA|nr:pleckstrin homology domain-containing family A member 7 isoform X2 [Xenopus laevis]
MRRKSERMICLLKLSLTPQTVRLCSPFTYPRLPHTQSRVRATIPSRRADTCPRSILPGGTGSFCARAERDRHKVRAAWGCWWQRSSRCPVKMAEAAAEGCLPAGWSYGVCRDGRVFFVDDRGRSTSWLHPRTCEPVNSGHMIRSDLPRGWEEGFTEEGASYFIDHNQRATTFMHPVTGDISPENFDFDLRDGHRSVMTQPASGQRPSSVISEGSTEVTNSTNEVKPVSKVHKPSQKSHSFGKRDHSIKRNPHVPVVVRGWLHKQDSSAMRLWKRRWFLLSDYCLFYYKDHQEEAVLGSIPLLSYVISPVAPEDRINRKYSFKAVHAGMRVNINQKGSGAQQDHSGMRTYYFSAETQEDMNGWIRAMNQAALMQTPLGAQSDSAEWSAAQVDNHVDSYKEPAQPEGVQRKEKYQGANEKTLPSKPEEPRRELLEDNRYFLPRSKNLLVSSNRESAFTDFSKTYRSQKAQPQPQTLERNGNLPSTYSTSPIQQNGTDGYRRVFVPQANMERHGQRRSNMVQVEQWVKVQKDNRRPSDYTVPRHVVSQHNLHFENYQTLPKTTRQPSGMSPPTNRHLPSDYKYAQDRVKNYKMSNKERKATKEGTVWQLYEWQQRQQFKHGSPTSPIYMGAADVVDRSRSKSTLDVPRCISVPPSPSDVPPSLPSKTFSIRRPNTPSERVTVRPEERLSDAPYIGSPQKSRVHAVKAAAHVNRRSMPAFGYMTHTADDTYLQLKKDLEYLDLKIKYNEPLVNLVHSLLKNSTPGYRTSINVSGRESQKDRSLKPVRIAESDVDVKLSILCEQDRILQDLEDKIRALKDNKDKLETVLEVLHRQMDQYKEQPQHTEKISYQQRLLQEDLVQIRAEMSKVSTDMENAWNEYMRLENDVICLRQMLQQQMNRSLSSQEKAQMQKDLWRIEDVTAGLSANKLTYKVLVESFKNPERKTVPSVNPPFVPSGTTAFTSVRSKSVSSQNPSVSLVKPTLDVRLYAQPYSQTRSHSQPQLLSKSDFILHSPTGGKPKLDEDAPPRPPLPDVYSPEGPEPSPTAPPHPALPPPPRDSSVIRHMSVRGLKRQSDERKRDREQGMNGDYRVDLRTYVSEPELAAMGNESSPPAPGFLGSDASYQTLPSRGLSGSTSRLPQSSSVTSYVTLRRGVNSDVAKERPKSAFERLYSGDNQRGKMSAEEQLERMKRHQKALVRERKRTLSQGDKQSVASNSYMQPIPADISSWKREQDFDLQLLERAARDQEEQDWLMAKVVRVTELDLEPEDYNLDISKELSMPDKVAIPERYIEMEPDEPMSLDELEARRHKVEKIKNILARSSVHNLQSSVFPEDLGLTDLDTQKEEQERMITISYALASEASRRSKQVAAHAVSDH